MGSFFSLLMPKGIKGCSESVSIWPPNYIKIYPDGIPYKKQGSEKLKNKIKLLVIGLGLAGIIFLILYKSSGQNKTYEYTEEYVQIKELPALLDFYYYTAEEWEEKLKEEEFGSVVTTDTIAWILEQTSSAEYITYNTEELSAENSFPSFGSKKKKIISRAEWNEIYGQLLDLLDDKGTVQCLDEIILKQEENALVCSLGTYRFDIKDLEIAPMSSMGFYIREDQIIGISALKSKSAVLSNVYVQNVQEGTLSFLANKEQYELQLNTENEASSVTPSAPSDNRVEMAAGHVCDLLWEDGILARVQIKEDTIQGDLIAVNDETIEIEGYGEISRSQNLPVYKTYGTIEQKELSDIVIANMKVEYVVAEDCIESILLTEPAQISRIRVLLLAEDGGPYYEDIYIGSSTSYRVIAKDGKKKKKASAVVKASKLLAQAEGSVRIKAAKKDGLLYLCDASGKRISNGYQGILELRKYPKGYAVVSELPIEQYLCSVVPSEMPASYELEALKAQAVCARSYAYIQLEHGDYAAFGAHVDDTTNYQVYNKQSRDEKTTAAVLDTAGTVISYQGETAEAYYFSTSAGVTGNGDAWHLDQESKYGYLSGNLIQEGGGEIDLSSEEAFGAFIEKSDAAAYENGKPFYRWKAVGDFSSEETQKKIKEILLTRRERTPEDILFFNQKGKQKERMDGFGNLVRLSIAKRSNSGIILHLKMEYEKGSVLVANEYNVRAILGAGVTDLTLSDGSKRDFALLPSAYTTLTPLENGTYSMTGGGYGHGIGMSQNGAQAMALTGKSFEEILTFFYKDIELTNGETE